MKVEDVCQKNPVTAGPDETVRDAAKRMKQQGVGSIPVVGSDACPLGMVTDRDIVSRVVRRGKDPDATRLRDVMSLDVVSVWSGAPVDRVFHRMRQEESRRVMVTDDEGRLVGVITVDDALPLIAGELQTISDVLAAQAPRPVEE